MVRCKILVRAPYSDYAGTGGNRSARIHSPGDIVRFPSFYAVALEQTGMVEIEPEYIMGVEVIEIDEDEEPIEITSSPDLPIASDSALEYARDNGIDLNQVTPTGASDRIILADVRLYHTANLDRAA